MRFKAPEASELADRLNALVSRRLGDAEVADVARIPKGISSLTYRAQLLEAGNVSPVIVKVAPPGSVPRANRDVLRQAGILAALESTPVPVPRVVAVDAGSPPDIPPLFIMTLLPGDGIDPTLPEDPALPDGVARARDLSMARALADLHAVPLDGVLPDEAELSLQDEVDRWTAVFATVDLGVEAIAARVLDRLVKTTPVPLPAVLNHGDYRFGNALFVGTDVSGLIDWEIAAKQDPRFDLADQTLYHGADSLLRMPESTYVSAPAEIVAAYEERAGRSMPDMEWFDAALRYKSAAALALLVKNSRKRGEPTEQLELVADRLPSFLARVAEK